MDDSVRAEYTACRGVNGRPIALALAVGSTAAVGLAYFEGLPPHAIIAFAIMAVVTGVGITVGYHRLFTHRSFATPRPVEWVLMVLGCMAGQSSPFFWVATHRRHHKHSDQAGDPHSPYLLGDRKLGFLRGFYHAHGGWVYVNGFVYPRNTVRDLTRRADFAWIDRHWFHWYLLGMSLPAAAGFLIGGTAYDALIGFLWGGPLRHFAALQVTFAVNSVTHLWGSHPHDTGDQSRNNLLVGLLALGEGWHNNHHAFPYSARHGLRWWQPDASWCLIWIMERVGMAWKVKRPKPAPAPHASVPTVV